jgi:molybdopterin-binding protein
MKKSKLFSINFRDVLKGLVVSILSGALTTVYQGVINGNSLDMNQIGISAGAAGLAYLSKNFFETNK